MGKFLEYASFAGGDLFLFQELAEKFSQYRIQKKGTALFVGILHQAFEEYAAQAGHSTQEEWQKIQGRFEDVSFSIATEDTISCIMVLNPLSKNRSS